jgi:hypothetical protein
MSSIRISGSVLSISGSYAAILMPTTSTPTISNMLCTTDGGSSANVSVPVSNNDSVGGTLEVSFTSNFLVGTVYSTSIDGNGLASVIIPNYTNPPGTITVYARVKADGKLVSNVASRTQTLNICAIV